MKRALSRQYPTLRQAKRRIATAPPGYRTKRRREFVAAMAECLKTELKGATT